MTQFQCSTKDFTWFVCGCGCLVQPEGIVALVNEVDMTCIYCHNTRGNNDYY